MMVPGVRPKELSLRQNQLTNPAPILGVHFATKNQLDPAHARMALLVDVAREVE